MDLLSAIKCTLMEKAKFGLHSLNAEKKKCFPTTACLGTACCRRRRTDGPVTCNGGRCHMKAMTSEIFFTLF